MLIDTHAHLQSDRFTEDLADVLIRAAEAGVLRMIVVGTTLEDSAEALRMARTYPGVAAAVGIHPSEAADTHVASALSELERLASRPEVVAVGEIGLDFYRDTRSADRQEELLEAQLELAARADLPVIVHSRRALDRLEGVLSSWRDRIRGGVMHCFPGAIEHARSFVRLGYLLGFGGTVTFPRSNALALLKRIGLAHVVLETDCPYLAPVPKRGRRNEPSYLRFTAERVAAELAVSLDTVETTTTRNACRLFHLDPAPPSQHPSGTATVPEASRQADRIRQAHR